jgi:2-methylcitrate dehydratase PrpD
VPEDLSKSFIEELCSFLSELTFDQLPDEVVEKTKIHIADTLGAALAGTCSGEYALAHQVINTPGNSLLWGKDAHIAPRDAALLNGIAAHAFELDDSGGCDHSGAVVMPALLAAISQMDAPVTGKDLIVAVNAGYEAGRRILEACGGYDAHNKLGWHSTGTCGTLAAAATVAKLRGYNAKTTQDAITLATSFSSGLWAFIHDGSQAKKLHAGRAAEGGLLAADLAATGYAGPSKVFDDVWGGFYNAFNRGNAQPELLTADLGAIWKVNRAVLKPYASCRSAHSAIDALQDILALTGHEPSQIASINIRCSQMLMNMCGHKKADSMASAQMSLPYALAGRCAFGTAGLKAYSQDRRSSPDAQTYLNKISIAVDDQMKPLDEPFVTICFEDGNEHVVTVPRATGSAERPMPRIDVKAKFDELATMALSASQVDDLWHYLMALDRAENSDDLLVLLTA